MSTISVRPPTGGLTENWPAGTGNPITGHLQGTLEMELAGLEPATSWVRSRRSSN